LSFNQVLADAICPGGDTDTIAAIACQIFGTHVGIAGIPTDLVNRLSELDEILSVADAFARHVGDGGPTLACS
jgi:ADP-ribosylglycohydrolase